MGSGSVGWTVVALLGTLAVAGCLAPVSDPPDGPAVVPYPRVGATARYNGEGWVSPLLPISGARGGGLLELEVEPIETRWDLYQDPHRVVPMNWTTVQDDPDNRTVSTDYVSTANGDVISAALDHPGSSGLVASGIESSWHHRGNPSRLGASLFWGTELAENKTFTRNVTPNPSPTMSRADVIRDRITLRFRIVGRDSVEWGDRVWEAWRIELANPTALTNSGNVASWTSLTFWVSSKTPFVVQREGVVATQDENGDTQRHEDHATLIESARGTGPTIRIDRSDRSYVWTPQAVDLEAWDGFRPPGNTSSFATFSLETALQVLKERDPTYTQYRVRYPDAMIASAGYAPPFGGEAKWGVRLVDPNETEGLKASVKYAPGRTSPYRTDAETVADPDWSWVPADTHDEILPWDGCVKLWNEITANASWQTVGYNVGGIERTSCVVVPGEPSGVSVTLATGFDWEGAIEGGILPRWPAR